MKSKILILRHGRTEGNKKKWFYGSTDIPLLPEGEEELIRQREAGLYPDIPKDALFFTTGLERTARTLELLFGKREFEVVRDLQELNFGVCECKSFDELKDDPIFEAWAYDESGDVVFPEGESRNQFSERVKKGFKHVMDKHALLELAKRHSDEEAFSVIVCHGGTISELFNQLYPGEKESQWDWMPEPGSGYLMEIEDGQLKKPCLLGEVTVY